MNLRIVNTFSCLLSEKILSLQILKHLLSSKKILVNNVYFQFNFYLNYHK